MCRLAACKQTSAAVLLLSETLLSPARPTPDAQLARIPPPPLALLLRSLGRRKGHKKGHEKEQLFIPERCLHLDSLPAPFPLPTSPCVPHRCLTPMPAYFLQSLPAAAGPLRQPRFPWLSLLLQAEGWLAALLQEPSSSHVNHKTLKKGQIFSSFLPLFTQASASPQRAPRQTWLSPRTPQR